MSVGVRSIRELVCVSCQVAVIGDMDTCKAL